MSRRGQRFCRYADDCNIYVRSRRAGERVMASVSRFLTNKLRLKVNEEKSAVATNLAAMSGTLSELVPVDIAAPETQRDAPCHTAGEQNVATDPST
ncbi:reverse transcriptase domain-containing protein [Mesorhizobium sp.]|uniref:reverse transcriptase domain-containing protein n=1 Tax=unclassified Mesorhizobium TaxID=325217 RepID=UPI000FD89AD4|nr:MAG: hypothetical protein EOS41_29035 [Mesorhizobium sp.]TGQ11355.1 hypothetical protein EN860_032410 [Mesorhizobium sp. M00.F.Ca.ET.217.01.1.1]TGV83800.1 hypothetical protein EN801_031835 [Mesorhizobium sp. M00.F.Ca.ET.158.01.1.1]